MANVLITPFMSLPNPVPGVDPGPDYANNIQASLVFIDQHNHSSGSGQQIQPNGISITSDLTFQSNNAIALRSTRFTSQVAVLSLAADVGCLYVVGNELYYNDVSGGHQVPITSNGSVNAGAGSITGLPSGTASATFSAGTFAFQSATSTAANLDGQSLVLRNSAANSKGLTLQAPASMAANIIQTLPTIPAAISFMQMDTSGNMSASLAVVGGITASNIAAGTITATQIAAATITGSLIASSINLPGKSVQESGLNVVVSNTNTTNSLAIIRGYILPPAVISSGEGFSLTRFAVGNWFVTFGSAFGDTPAISATISTTSGFGIGSCTVLTPSASGFGLLCYNGSGTLIDVNWSFVAIGQRA